MGVGINYVKTLLMLATIILIVILIVESMLASLHIVGGLNYNLNYKQSQTEQSSIPLNGLRIYVVGPSSLANLISRLVPGSIVVPININELAYTSNDSVVIIDWRYMSPLIVNGRVNMSSPIFKELATIISKGDLVAIYGNSENESTMGFILGLAWARGTNTELHVQLTYSGEFTYEVNEYLFGIPILPVQSNGTIVMLAYGGRGWLAMAPATINDLPGFIMPFLLIKELSRKPEALFINLSNPCWDEWYIQYIFIHTPGNKFYIGSNDFIFMWLAPEWGGPYGVGYGINAYGDGNGTFTIDSCIDAPGLSSSILFNLLINPVIINWMSYQVTNTLINNSGYESWQLGSINLYASYAYYNHSLSQGYFSDSGGIDGIEPWPTPSTSYYEFPAGILLIWRRDIYWPYNFPIILPSGSTERITLLYSPINLINLNQFGPLLITNFTWIYAVSNGDEFNGQYSNAFGIPFGDASLVIALRLRDTYTSTYTVFLPVYFENLVVTRSYPVQIGHGVAYMCNYKLMRTKLLWMVVVSPTSGQVSLGNVTDITNQLSGTSSNGYLTELTQGNTLCSLLPSP